MVTGPHSDIQGRVGLNAINRHEAAAAYLWARAQERVPVPSGFCVKAGAATS